MKQSSLLFFLLLFRSAMAQDVSSNVGIEPTAAQSAEAPCISAQTYTLIEQRCNDHTHHLHLENDLSESAPVTLLSWPLKAASNLHDYSFYVITAYVDQNTTAGMTSDYNCGTRTYDGHRGTDIATTPFGFYKLDSSQVEVVAAAPGVIIDKNDGQFDRNCGVNNLPANYVILQHADGSRTLYWHMKKNSVTTKAIGQSVVTGEYLGVVGSSGSSTGPHLHFEVWAGSTNATRVDPYSGNCNSLNASSWWVEQKPYAEPAVIKSSVHTTDIVVPGCPNTETPNESACYSIPFQGPGLPAGSAKFYIFMRNETPGLVAEVSILNPNGSIFNSWTHTSTNSYNASYRAWTKPLPTIGGIYTFQAVYNGQTSSSTFEIVKPVITANGPTTVCSGATVSLTASGGTSYVWSNGASTATIQVGTSGSYQVTATGANGCTAVSAATMVTVLAAPTATITANGPTTVCSGATVSLTASGGTSYTWSNGASTATIQVGTSGSYQVTATGANGCTAISAATMVTVLPLPTATITANGPTTVCSGATVSLTASGGTSYVWSNGATTATIQVGASGSYQVTATGANGCTTVSAATTVTVLPLPTATITANGPTTVCSGATVSLTASGGTSYTWSNGASTATIQVGASGSYQVTATGANGCTAVSAPTTVTLLPLPIATITANGSTTVCSGETVSLTATGGTSYTWSNGVTSATIQAGMSGSYQVTATGANGCTAVSMPTLVMINPLPAIPVISAAGNLLTSSASEGNQWFLNGNPIPGATEATFQANESGMYTVQVTDANNCVSESAGFNYTSTGIHPVAADEAWIITPNPNEGLFYIETSGSMKFQTISAVEIFTTAGVPVGVPMHPIGHQTELDIRALPSGIYLVCIATSQMRSIKKVFKK